ncbi:MAG: chemotaxis protein CheW [Dethiobacteria bacterium]|jgi:two-component system chemotaxis sensor kinase CheA
MEEYEDLFLAEAQEYLLNITRCLLAMEKNPDGEHLAEMFRVAHSLKGMAGTMGYELMADLAHEMESLLDKLHRGEVAVGLDCVNLLLEAVDLLQLLTDNLHQQEDFRPEVGALQKRLRTWQQTTGEKIIFEDVVLPQDVQEAGKKSPDEGGILTWQEMINAFEKEMLKEAPLQGKKIYQIHVRLCQDTLLKSVRVYMVLKVLEKAGEIIKAQPSLQALEEEDFDRDFFLLLVGKPQVEALKKSLEGITEIEKVNIIPVNIGDKPTAAGEEKNGGSREKMFPGKVSSLSGRPGEKMVRVETAKLDNLVNLVGELVINRTRVLELGKKVGDAVLDSSLEQLERITAELQNAVMTLRMVPVKQVFNRFPRMVRDLSLEKNKKVELIISGEETELDRTIINQVGDPLVHLLRNAVDHGLEEEDERKRRGKDPLNRIFLSAHHEGSHVVISVEDDGRGIDLQAIKLRALEKKIISKEEMEEIGPEEALQLIFRSGLSTSREVTDVSGRGVGMDVVKTAIETLHGTVEVQSEPGNGSRFILRFPLTLAIIRTLMVQCGREMYAIPVEAIRENLFIEPQEIRTISRERVITLRNEVLPLYFLQELLGRGQSPEQEYYPVVVVQAGGKKAGFAVDALLGQQEVVIKSLGRFVNDMQGIAGATVLGDGRVILILDIAGLLEGRRLGFGKKSINH